MIDVDLSVSVSQVNEYIKKKLEQDEGLRYLIVKGEISNFKRAMNGHFYFSLKDDKSSISCVMFKDYGDKLKFNPKDGDEVKAIASISCFPQRGTYSLRVYQLDESGKGKALLELEELKKKLALEGLFDESRKKKINIYPSKIGLVTASNSAALKDMVTNIQRRYPPCEIYVFPCLVQGDGASEDIIRAFNLTKNYDLDTIIIGRGGGSSEDLSAFNDEKLVREIAKSIVPVISAVGHEIDMTLVDFVSDKRASTPTGAAELATVDKREIEQLLMTDIEMMKEAISNNLKSKKEDFESLKEDLYDSYKVLIDDKKKDLKSLKERLSAVDPKKVLERGFSITETKDGKIISSVNDVTNNEEIITKVKDGEITSKVVK